MAHGGVGRNERCPCGSGRRFKECHGAFAAVPLGAALRRADPGGASSVEQLMQAAQQAQLSGNAVEAAVLYRRVLEVDPTNYDATHMLGVVEYQSGSYEEAIALVRRATELRPDLGKARDNLQTLESLPLIEREICRDVLPRLVSRVEPVADLSAYAASAGIAHLVLGGDGPAASDPALARLLAALRNARLTVWTRRGASLPGVEVRTLDVAGNSHPVGGLLLLYGATASVAGWIDAARASRVVLIVTADDPCAVIDRVDELCAARGERPGLVCVSRELAERLRLPVHAVIPAPEAAPQPGP
jgi:tetratricopeptide (TPR) repeat protein